MYKNVHGVVIRMIMSRNTEYTIDNTKSTTVMEDEGQATSSCT